MTFQIQFESRKETKWSALPKRIEIYIICMDARTLIMIRKINLIVIYCVVQLSSSKCKHLCLVTSIQCMWLNIIHFHFQIRNNAIQCFTIWLQYNVIWVRMKEMERSSRKGQIWLNNKVIGQKLTEKHKEEEDERQKNPPIETVRLWLCVFIWEQNHFEWERFKKYAKHKKDGWEHGQSRTFL